MIIDDHTFKEFSRLIASRCGIQLLDNRQKMLENRISNRIRHLGMNNFNEYLRHVQTAGGEDEVDALIDAVTTNYTTFYRDPTQFEHLAEQLRLRMQETTGRIRIWSAACSTGEEPYTLAMTAIEVARSLGQSTDNIRILATDIATSVLEKAAKGTFAKTAVEKLPVDKQGFFTQQIENDLDDEEVMVANDQLKKLIIFRKLNLCEDHLRVPDEIDFIFCRNVLLYFDTPTQQQILNSCVQILKPGGYLYVGACEPVRALIPDADAIGPSVFKRPAVQMPAGFSNLTLSSSLLA